MNHANIMAWPTIDICAPFLHNEHDSLAITQQPNVVEWVTVDRHEVSDLPHLNRAKFTAQSKRVGGIDCGGCQCFAGSHPEFDVQLQLPRVRAHLWIELSVGSTGHLHARVVEFLEGGEGLGLNSLHLFK